MVNRKTLISGMMLFTGAYDGGQLQVGTGLSVTGLSTIVGVGTFIRTSLYVGGDLFIISIILTPT